MTIRSGVVLVLVAAACAFKGAHAHALVTARNAIDRLVAATKLAYAQETRSIVVDAQLRRIARDGVLVSALERSDLKRAQAEAARQLNGRINHHAHVTRISVVRGSRVLVDRVAAPHGAVSGRRSFSSRRRRSSCAGAMAAISAGSRSRSRT